MHPSRREFLGLSLAAGTAAAFARLPRARAEARLAPRPAAPLRILILGGTSFVGPACTDAGLARGHSITLFNRGLHEAKRKEAGRPSVVPDGVEVLYGNRDPNLTAYDPSEAPKESAPKSKSPATSESKKEEPAPSEPKPEPPAKSSTPPPKGLSQLEGRKWDAVIDTSGFFPRMVKASAELLAPNVRQYVFISSISVYKDNDKPNMDESDTLATLEDPNTEDFGPQFKNYGGGKTACEQAAEAAMPGRVANVRPGFIVGPRDTTRRFIYWPLRVEQGGEMAVPGKPDDPIQIIDVRDLGDWIIHLIETNTNGAFNATSPPMSMRAMLEGCRKGAKADTTFTWIDPKFIEEEQHIPIEETFPLWIPPSGENAGFHMRSVAKAVKAGLKFRPVEDTAAATLAWYHGLPADIQSKVAALMPPEKERALLKAWHEQKQ
jgi:2'-hydroxyisoflavone reductase